MRSDMAKIKRPKWINCERCGETVKVKPRGSIPKYCAKCALIVYAAYESKKRYAQELLKTGARTVKREATKTAFNLSDIQHTSPEKLSMVVDRIVKGRLTFTM
jgi:hypothetical protein